MRLESILFAAALAAAMSAQANDLSTGIGGAIGGAGGAAIGNQVGGSTGAIVGGAVGGGAGGAVGATGKAKTGAAIGGAIGGGAGAAIGNEVGGSNGAIIGAGVGGAAGAVIGGSMTADSGKPQSKRPSRSAWRWARRRPRPATAAIATIPARGARSDTASTDAAPRGRFTWTRLRCHDVSAVDRGHLPDTLARVDDRVRGPRHRLSWRSGNHLATHMRRTTSALP